MGDRPVAAEALTYAQIAERLNIATEAARSLVRRHRLPKQVANDGRVLIHVDFAELPHKKLNRPLAALQVGDQQGADRSRLEELWARIAVLEADLRLAHERAAGLRQDYERERDRGDRLLTELSAVRKTFEDRMATDRASAGDQAAELTEQLEGERTGRAADRVQHEQLLAMARAASDKATAELVELARRLADLTEQNAAMPAETETVAEPQRSRMGRAWRWFLRN
jgi:hypothetical protein